MGSFPFVFVGETGLGGGNTASRGVFLLRTPYQIQQVSTDGSHFGLLYQPFTQRAQFWTTFVLVFLWHGGFHLLGAGGRLRYHNYYSVVL